MLSLSALLRTAVSVPIGFLGSEQPLLDVGLVANSESPHIGAVD